MKIDKRQLLLYFMVLLTIINIGLVIAVVFLVRQHDFKELPYKQESFQRGERFMEDELGFDENQLREFHESRLELRGKVMPLRQKLRNLNSSLISESTSVDPDTARCQQLSDQIGELHAEIKRVTYMHIMEVSNMVAPEKVQHLNDFYLRMFGDDQPGRGKGKGQQHRYRRGKMPVDE